MNNVIVPPPVPTIAVRNTADTYPVHRIYCVGRNYAEHAREMGHDPNREPPFFFQKNPDTIVPNGGKFPYPDKTHDVHHEIEMVVALGAGGKDISIADALDCVYGYAVGLDLTRRDLQGEAKKMGRPWDSGKGFDQAAPCTTIRPASQIGHPSSARIWLAVDGKIRQDSNVDKLIWSIPETIEHLSGLWELQPGDLIYSGTPEGVGPVEKGETMTGGVDGVGEIEIRIV